jgi:hypothetical protein
MPNGATSGATASTRRGDGLSRQRQLDAAIDEHVVCGVDKTFAMAT